MGVVLSSATNVNLVAGPGSSPSPVPLTNPMLPEVKMGSRGGSRLPSISSPGQVVSMDGAFGAGSPPQVGMVGEGGMGGTSPGALAASPIPNNQRHKQRRKESWDNK